MQRIVGLILILWGLGWLASQMPSMSDQSRSPANSSWRRTCVGWERADRLQGDAPPPPPAVHPAVLGLGLLLFALSGLIGLAPEEHVTPDQCTRGKRRG